MKYALFAVLCSMVVSGSLFASPQDIVDSNGDHTVAAVPAGEPMSFQAVLDAQTNEDVPNHGSWHCTAYAEGHGHDLGYSYEDVHYRHAYYGAMRKCERATGHHCHDVHCHEH